MSDKYNSNYRTYGAVDNWLPSYIRGRSRSVANKLENCIDLVYRLKNKPGIGDSKFLSYVPTPYQLVEDQLDKLADYGGKLSGSMLCFNLEYLAVLRNVNKYSSHDLDLYLYTDDSFVRDAISKSMSNVTVLYDPAQSRDSLFDFMYRTLKQVDYKPDGSKRIHEYQVLKNEMKFDNVVGNPPYQVDVGPDKTEPIWQIFVEKSLDVLKDEIGYMSLVHPSGWRSPKGRFKDVQDMLLRENDLKFLKVSDFDDGKYYFGVGTTADYYAVNKSRPSNSTTIEFKDKSKNNIDVTNLEFIPNSMFERVQKIIASDNEETVDLIHTYAYETRKDLMSKTKNSHYIHPCVYTITQSKGITCYYSNTDEEGHFGIPKVIWSNGLGTYPIIDETGKYGMTQFAYAIADEPENLPKIKQAMESDEFIEIMSSLKFTNNKYSKKVIELMRKDFWKEFV